MVWVQNFEGGSVASRGDNLRESVGDLDHFTAMPHRCVALSPFGRSSSLGTEREALSEKSYPLNAKEHPLTLSNTLGMASEVLSSPDLCSVIFKTLEESGLCACAAVCHAWREAALSDALWKALADQCAEALGLCPGATAEQRSDTGRMLEALGGGSAAPGGHRALLMRRRTVLPQTLCLDFGRGYAKYGFADSPKCAQLQICSPGAEACMASFISAAMHKLRRAESRSPGPTFTGGWHSVRGGIGADSAAAAAIVAEPFRMAAAHEDEERRRFHLAVRRDLARWRVPRCCVVDS